MSVYFDKLILDQKCKFRKGYSTQHCLLNLLEIWKNSVDKGKSFNALLTYLSKAFDCLDHELLNECFFHPTDQLLPTHLDVP